MSTGAGYVRVYHTIVDDERFADVYHDSGRLGAWLQLLLLADAMYPASAPLPAYVSRRHVAHLAQCGLIELADHGQYRVHGLAAERHKRSQVGRTGAAMRWQSVGDADAMRTHSNGNAEPMHPRTEPNRTEPSQSQSDFRRRVERTKALIAELQPEGAE